MRKRWPAWATTIFLVVALTEATDSQCPRIVDTCSCPQPHTLRCTGSVSSLGPIVEKLSSNFGGVNLLDLSLNNLSVITKDTFGNRDLNLQGLVLSDSNLQDIEDGGLSSLRHTLTALNLPNNSLAAIPKEVFSLPLLQRLDVSQNHMTQLHHTFPTATLEYLDLSDNRLTSINGVTVPLTLKTLKLRRNNISLKGIVHFQCYALQSLDLSYNKLEGNLTESSFVNQHGRLASLDMSFNRIKAIGRDALFNFPGLKSLNLRSNRIELLDPKAFRQLKQLSFLDLSHNFVVELSASGLFEPLVSLTNLDMSHNYLQVVDSAMTRGLGGLHYLDLRDNDIYKLSGDSMGHIKAISTLLLDDNPLDCNCQLEPFRHWLKQSSLDLESVNGARCATPPLKANAMVANFTVLTCDDDEQQDVASLLELQHSKLMSFVSKSIEHDTTLKLRWNLNLSDFRCEHLQLFREDYQGNKKEIYSRPVTCNNNKVLDLSVDLRKAGVLDYKNHMLLSACLSVLLKKDTNGKRSLESDCSDVFTVGNNSTTSDYHYHYNDGKKPILRYLAATLDYTQVLVSYKVDLQDSTEECKVSLQVEAVDADRLGERVVAVAHRISCTGETFLFTGLNDREEMKVCAWIEQQDDPQDSRAQCAKVKGPQVMYRARSQGNEKAPVLPLVLTLVFLGVGIAALVVLYLIVRGYLSDRRKASLVQMRQNGGRPEECVQQQVRRRMYWPLWTARLWTWKSVLWRRHHRHHHVVPEADEMALQEDSCFDTSLV